MQCEDPVGDPGSGTCLLASAATGCISQADLGNRTCLRLDADAQLCPSTTSFDLTVVLSADNVTFDCNGQTIDHRFVDGDPARRGISAPYTRSVSNVKIQRCTFQNVGHYGADLKRKFRGAELTGTMTGHQNIVLDDVTFRNTGKIGVYVGQNSNGVVLNRVRIYNSYLGVYLEAGGVGTTISHSVIDGTRDREGIAIDSTQYNTIEHTTIRNTNGASIRIYTNCGENYGQVCPKVRPLQASYNIIRYNDLYDQVEVAWRQGQYYAADWCAALAPDSRWTDHAHYNRFYGNTFHDANLVIKASDNPVYGNRFLGSSNLRVMGGFFAPPLITRITATDNLFDRGEIELDIGDRLIVFPYTTSASAVVNSTFINNRRLSGVCLIDEGNTCSSSRPATPLGGWVGLTEWNGSDLAPQAVGMSGQWLGGWNHSGEEVLEGVGRFTDGTHESFLLRSPWGLGAIRRWGSYLYASGAARHGATLGAWPFAATDSIDAIADFDGDGRDELFVRSNTQAGILGFSGTSLQSTAMRPFESWFGWWRFTAAQRILGVGDFDGNGREELLIRDPVYGLAIVGQSGAGFSLHSITFFNSNLGGYTLRSDVQVLGIADFDGAPGGAQEIAVRSLDGIAFLKRQGSSLVRITHTPWNGAMGWWALDFQQEAVATGDFDGNGKQELVLKDRRRGLAFIELGSGGAAMQRYVPFNQRYGGWALSSTNKILGAVDVNADGKDDLLVSSGWGRGVLRTWGSTLTHLWMKSHGSLGPSRPEHTGPVWPIASSDSPALALDSDGDGTVELLYRR